MSQKRFNPHRIAKRLCGQYLRQADIWDCLNGWGFTEDQYGSVFNQIQKLADKLIKDAGIDYEDMDINNEQK